MVRIGEISAYWQKPTVAPVVQVDSPEAVETIRRLYPYDHPIFTDNWQAMSDMSTVRLDMPALMVGTGIAVAMSFVGWELKGASGAMVFATAGSILGAVVYNLVKDALG